MTYLLRPLTLFFIVVAILLLATTVRAHVAPFGSARYSEVLTHNRDAEQHPFWGCIVKKAANLPSLLPTVEVGVGETVTLEVSTWFTISKREAFFQDAGHSNKKCKYVYYYHHGMADSQYRLHSDYPTPVAFSVADLGRNISSLSITGVTEGVELLTVDAYPSDVSSFNCNKVPCQGSRVFFFVKVVPQSTPSTPPVVEGETPVQETAEEKEKKRIVGILSDIFFDTFTTGDISKILQTEKRKKRKKKDNYFEEWGEVYVYLETLENERKKSAPPEEPVVEKPPAVVVPEPTPVAPACAEQVAEWKGSIAHGVAFFSRYDAADATTQTCKDAFVQECTSVLARHAEGANPDDFDNPDVLDNCRDFFYEDLESAEHKQILVTAEGAYLETIGLSEQKCRELITLHYGASTSIDETTRNNTTVCAFIFYYIDRDFATAAFNTNRGQ